MLVWIIQLGAIIESARMERAEVIAREHERDRRWVVITLLVLLPSCLLMFSWSTMPRFF
jgi:hypothetical protein